MKKIISIIVLSLISTASYSDFGPIGFPQTKETAQCHHDSHEPNRFRESAYVGKKWITSSCNTTGPHIPTPEPCIGFAPFYKLWIATHNQNIPDVRTQVIISSDKIKKSTPSFPIRLVFNKIMKPDEAQEVSLSSDHNKGLIYAC